MGRERERWRAFWAAAAAAGTDEERLFADLDARYREPHRHYHGWGHVLACLDRFEAVRALCERPLGAELALWYHDAVYDPRAADNEAKSAALARAAGIRMGLGEEAAAEAAALVLLTAHGAQPGPGRVRGADAALVLDVDLAVLGSPPGEFAAYEAAVRMEYAFVLEDQYRKGRAKVLRGFLARPRIYLTDAFGQALEAQARQNIEASLARLEGQPA